MLALPTGSPVLQTNRKDGCKWPSPKQINSLSHSLLHCLPIWEINQMTMAYHGNQPKLAAATQPSQVITVDKMESSTLGFIAQLKRNLTTKRYQYATTFVDHYSKFGFIYLQKTLSSESCNKQSH